MVALVVVALISIWFDNPARFGPAAGFATANAERERLQTASTSSNSRVFWRLTDTGSS